jgi:hypothetical protein
MVIDHVLTLMASYNWTCGAPETPKFEPRLFAAVAAAYAAHWNKRLAVSAPFGGRQE